MAPSAPQSPHDDVMHFIENLGEHLEEAMHAATSPGTEKGDRDQKLPDYNEKAFEEKAEREGDENEPFTRRRGPGGPPPPGDRRERGPGDWKREWRDSHRGHPFFAGQWGQDGAGPSTHPFGGNFPFGGERGGHGCRRGGMGGPRGGMFFGGPWGWGSRRHGHHNRGPWGHCDPDNNNQEFTPAVDVFDTTTAFVVHIALAGALKSDIGINYDFDNGELEVSGVVHRPGDEEFLKTIVESERRVGAFDRKIKLESNGKAVAVDADAITAKFENGLLEVTVPKVKKGDEPEKKKISIE